jgi:membrane protease YdiL (CAAX protease family)
LDRAGCFGAAVVTMPREQRSPGTRANVGGSVARLVGWLSAGQTYPASEGDRRAVSILGLELPVRATVAIIAVALLLLLEQYGHLNAIAEAVVGAGGSSGADRQRLQSIERLITQGVIPLALVILVMRDRPSRYGLRLGDIRAGVLVALAGCVVMSGVVLVTGRFPAFVSYYGSQGAPAPDVFLTSALEVIPAEFFFRGFLLFALLRVMGPVAVVVATVPFAFAHLGKPEIETLSTLGGGFLYGWLDWRTGSVVWSGLAHTWILGFLVIVASSAGA